MIWRIGTYIWTGCAAGWLVIGVVASSDEAYMLGLCCIGAAYVWTSIGESL